ncbi:ABC transporter permease [Bradyrhizobium sp. LHD-71]|uniref:ABC transporter permease n=1 Tax=Bradyrhizobium sp. LHD-71 TaxID=3072141 RepID=UPI00280D6716|nr:ABC transporter permease [Bradyrhizobium sp. LHD-71]MDQ8731020.1 ABC transporter permease [Bradyrhizobium sp. LHD-71]
MTLVATAPQRTRDASADVRAGLHPALTRFALALAGLAVLLGLWWIGTDILPPEGSFARKFSPGTAIPTLGSLLIGSDLPVHILVSLKRVLVGLLLALAIGVPVGLAVGSWSKLNEATSPAFQFLRMISPLSWMPLAVMVFGVGDPPIYFLLAFAAVWPILLNTADAVRKLDPSWLRLSQSLAATRWETLRTIIVPGVLSHILTGLRLAIGVIWIVLVPCEMLGVSAGLGYFILDTRDRLAYSELMAVVLLIGFLGFLLDMSARALYQLAAPGSRQPRVS